MPATRSTVDAAEVERFERLGEDWWNPRGSMRALHKFNPLRVNWIAARIAAHFPGADGGVRDRRGPDPLAGIALVDIGCGGGLFSEAIARKGAEVTGIDPGAGNIGVARRHADKSALNIDYCATTAESLVESGARFDVVCALEVIEHVSDAPAFLAAAAALVRPGGLFFAATLNRTLKSFAFAIIGAEYILGWVPKGTHQWEKFITPQELEEASETVGLEAMARTGIVYDPLDDTWQISRDMAINYMMAAAKPA